MAAAKGVGDGGAIAVLPGGVEHRLQLPKRLQCSFQAGRSMGWNTGTLG